MADVQLEHGYLRIANALDEAITYAEFTGTEHKIVRIFVRLTYGWQRRRVRISLPELADLCHLPNTGGFRRALAHLLQEGVVIQLEAAEGTTPALYELQKNFEQWGELSVAARALERRFGRRPDSGPPAPSMPPQGQSSEPPQLELEDDSPASHAPTGAVRLPPQGQADSPHRGSLGPVTDSTDNGLQSPKDSERHLKTNSSSTAAAAASAGAQLGQELVSTALAGIRRRWPGAPISPHFASSAEVLGTQLLEASVPTALACQAITRRCAGSRLAAPPQSVGYFEKAILDAQRDAQHEEVKGNGSSPSRTRTAPSPVSALLGGTDPARRAELELEYNAARRKAGIAWGKNPANAAAYREILEAANRQFDGLLEGNTWGIQGRDLEVVIRCAAAADFPTLELWLEHQHGSK